VVYGIFEIVGSFLLALVWQRGRVSFFAVSSKA